MAHMVADVIDRKLRQNLLLGHGSPTDAIGSPCKSRLPAEGIGWPAGVRPTLEHTALLVGDNRAYRSGKPRPFRPPLNLMAEVGECLSGQTIYATFQIE